MSKKQDPFRAAVGNRLANLRVAKDFDTIRAFAKDLEVEEDRYAAWEKGKSLIPPQIVAVLRARYGVTADWMYYGDTAGLSRALYAALQHVA